MKLYLSSYRLGNESDKLKAMMCKNKKAAVINNSLDFSLDFVRLAQSKQQEIDDLNNLGFEAEDLDLKNYFGKKEELRVKLKEYGFVWVRGGNTFVLRRAMAESGFDEIIKDYKSDPDFIYGGYSAGVCVITPTLKGLEITDDPVILPAGYKNQMLWDGLGILNYSVAVHYKSDHPESVFTDKEVEFYETNNMPYKTLRDGEVIIGEYE